MRIDDVLDIPNPPDTSRDQPCLNPCIHVSPGKLSELDYLTYKM